MMALLVERALPTTWSAIDILNLIGNLAVNLAGALGHPVNTGQP